MPSNKSSDYKLSAV